MTGVILKFIERISYFLNEQLSILSYRTLIYYTIYFIARVDETMISGKKYNDFYFIVLLPKACINILNQINIKY